MIFEIVLAFCGIRDRAVLATAGAEIRIPEANTFFLVIGEEWM